MAKKPLKEAPQAPERESDEDLFELFRAGRTECFDTLVLRYKDRAFWVAHNMVRHAEESLDLAQEAFARAFGAASSFDSRLKFSTWFFRILVNLCIDHLRKKKTRRTLTTPDAPEAAWSGPGPDETAESHELREQVREVLQLLPEKHRTILVLRDIQGLSALEIADILGCTHATARWRLHRARGRFREVWEESFGPWS